MRCLFLCCVIGLLTVSCSAPRPVLQNWPDGSQRAVGQTQGGRQVGEWSYYHDNGQRAALGSWRRDRPDGHWRWWGRDGQVQREGAYVDGLRQGYWRYYHDNGELRAEGAYQRGRQDAWWRYYGEDGALASAGAFDRGARSLVWTWFDARGAPREQSVYWRGKRVVHRPGGADRVAVPPGAELQRRGELYRLQTPGGQELRVLFDQAGTVIAVLAREAEREQFAAMPGTQLLVYGRRTDGVPSGDWLLRDDDGLQWYRAAGGELAAIDASGETPAETVVADAPDAGLVDAGGRQEPRVGAALALLDSVLSWSERADAETLSDAPSVTNPAPPPQSQVEISPTAAPPNKGWTMMDERKYQMSLNEYRDGEKQGRFDYGSQSGSRVRRALHGKPLPQRRFIASDGNVIDLDSLRGRKLCLVVLRGFAGQICPYCAAQSRALIDQIEHFRKADTEVMLVYPGGADSVPEFVNAVSKLGGASKLPVPVLLDVDLSLVRALGIEHDLASPTSIIVDSEGLVHYAYVGKDRADRPSVPELLKQVAGAP